MITTTPMITGATVPLTDVISTTQVTHAHSVKNNLYWHIEAELRHACPRSKDARSTTQKDIAKNAIKV